ncbi:KGK domain-containing protein [Pleurocapsa sp. PCC 7319]|uniref:KGK domain-containing protein n=1 Tax=Pleurocapsa sp. PCC 7319 TaxID=118161 RepID=UPI00034C3F98|nr:KGK domain-containing protein [Pleurocapsa sp. PCC 7319]
MKGVEKFINGDEVISINNKDDNILINHHTYKAQEFLDRLIQSINANKMGRWLNEGVPCKLLSPNQNWQKGKIKICLRFIPEQSESILDDIRHENQ